MHLGAVTTTTTKSVMDWKPGDPPIIQCGRFQLAMQGTFPDGSGFGYYCEDIALANKALVLLGLPGTLVQEMLCGLNYRGEADTGSLMYDSPDQKSKWCNFPLSGLIWLAVNGAVWYGAYSLFSKGGK